MNEKKFFIAPLDRLRDLFGGKRTTALCLDSEKKKEISLRFPSLSLSMSWGDFVLQVPPWLPTSEPMSATLADWHGMSHFPDRSFKVAVNWPTSTTITKASNKTTEERPQVCKVEWNAMARGRAPLQVERNSRHIFLVICLNPTFTPHILSVRRSNDPL